MVPALKKEFVDIQANFRVWIHPETHRWHDNNIKSNALYHTDKNSQYSTITWSVWLNGWVFIYELSGCDFESPCCHLNCRYGASFEQGVPWHLGKP